MTAPRHAPLERYFTSQHLRPAAVEPLGDERLGRLERVALTLDGTVTVFLEMLTGEAIRSEELRPAAEAGADLVPALRLAEGESFRFRAVLLRGENTGIPFVAARSLLVPSRVPAGFLEALATSRAGIGQALYTTRSETLRELLWFGKMKNANLPPGLPTQVEDPLCRCYAIVYEGKPMVCIEEIFLTDLNIVSEP